jgi:hypothetical protein
LSSGIKLLFESERSEEKDLMSTLIRENVNNRWAYTTPFAAPPCLPVISRLLSRVFSRWCLRNLAILLSAAVILGVVSPSPAASFLDYEIYAPGAAVIASQSVLVQYFYHTTLPIRIVSAYLAAFSAVTPHGSLPQSKNKKSAPRPVGGSENALLPVSAVSSCCLGSGSEKSGSLLFFWPAREFAEMACLQGSSLGLLFLFCAWIMLCCRFFRKARGSIVADAVMSSLQRMCYPVSPYRVSRVFLWILYAFISPGRLV